MANWFTVSQQARSRVSPRYFAGIASTTLIALSLWASPSFAKDPFRANQQRAIDDRTEAAFRAYFEQGDYFGADRILQQTNADEPLAYALKASLAYVRSEDAKEQKDMQKRAAYLEEFNNYATKTRESAQRLMAKDSLRGNLYLAVGHFLKGSYIVLKEGTVQGTPAGLGEVQQAFQYLDAAEAKYGNDPELSLLKGYIDLFLSLNLPFSSPKKAIERLEKYAGPRYLADRGLALGYRDMKKLDKALDAVERARKGTPENPEVMYLKGQILFKQGKYQESLTWFDQALAKKDLLPLKVQKEIGWERQRAQNEANSRR